MEETKKRTKSQTSKLARRRGHQFERDCANELKVVFPNAKRHLEYQSQEAEKGFDIDGTFPYLFQCKRGRRYASINKIFEVKPSCSKEIPVLITQGDHCEPMVALSPITTNFFFARVIATFILRSSAKNPIS